MTMENRGFGGQKSPSVVQGQSLGRGLGDEVPQKLKHAILFAYLHKNPTAHVTSFQKFVLHILQFLLHILCSKTLL